MKYLKFIMGSVIFYVAGLIAIQAQETIAVAGGNATGSEGSVSFTVGQNVYSTYNSTSGSISQGVQQPYEISVVTGVDDASGILLDFIVYPNPTTDYLKLVTDDYNSDKLYYKLSDINGRILENRKIESSETSIFMGNYEASIYFLKVFDDMRELKTFKIIKY